MNDRPAITVAVTEEDLLAAVSELHNSGYIDWVSVDGTTVRLVSADVKEGG